LIFFVFLDSGSPSDLGFTRDRQLERRKSGKPDLRARRPE